MSLREDFKRPLNEVENVILRRLALVVTSFVMVPTALTFGMLFGAIMTSLKIRHFFVSCWKGKSSLPKVL